MPIRHILLLVAALLLAPLLPAAPARAGEQLPPPAPAAAAASSAARENDSESEVDHLEATPQAEEALSGATLPPPVAESRTMCDRLRDLTARPLEQREHRLALHTMEMLHCQQMPAAAGSARPQPPQAGGAGALR